MKISIEALVRADLSTVWHAWTTPEHIVEWNYASPDWHAPRATLELKPGSHFSYRMEAKDGSAGFDFEGTFLRVEDRRLIEFSLGDDRTVTVTFTKEEDGVRVTESFDAEDTHSAEQQRAGWQAILDNFARYVEEGETALQASAEMRSATDRGKVATCLWFDGVAEQAAAFYVSILPDSEITGVMRPDADSPPLVIEFTLSGTPFQALNGGPQFIPTEAASIVVHTNDQLETDQLWGRLIEEGGSESMCGWCKDKFGVSWQVVPRPALALLSSPDRTGAARAMDALMNMKKIDIRALRLAHDGAP